MLKILNRLLRANFFPISFKIFNLVVFLSLIYFGVLAHSTDPVFLKELRNTNISNLIVWSVWWPVIIILSVVFGRVWCMVCPVETVTSFFSKFGLKLKRNKLITSGWIITGFYFLILIVGIQGYIIHRNPFSMAIYLAIIFAVSIIIGLLYEKNTFCRYVCPVGYLLGMYSRLSSFGWRVRDKKACENCKDKSCIEKNYIYNLNNKSCGVDLYPAKIEDNIDCILCGGCMKTCDKNKSETDISRPNPGIIKNRFLSGLISSKPMKTSEMVFILIVSGFVISEILSEYQVTNAYLNYFPDLIKNLLMIKDNTLVGIIYGLINFFILPSMIWIIPYIIYKAVIREGSRMTLSEYLCDIGIAFIPIIASAHIAKSILKFSSRIPYFQHIKTDLTGIETARLIIEKKILLIKNPVIADTIISFILAAIIVTGIIFSIKFIKSRNTRIGFRYFYLIPVLYGVIFLATIIFWRFIF